MSFREKLWCMKEGLTLLPSGMTFPDPTWAQGQSSGSGHDAGLSEDNFDHHPSSALPNVSTNFTTIPPFERSHNAPYHTRAVPTPRFPLYRPPSNVRPGDTPTRCLPILNIRADVQITNLVAQTFLTQTFSNWSDQVIGEARYVFPLYQGASVTAFRCEIGDHEVLEGTVKPKETARQEYDQAKNDREVVALLEEHTPEIFETHIGNIAARTTVKIHLTYVHVLAPLPDGSGASYIMPTSIAPRYGAPPESLDLQGQYAQESGLEVTVNVWASSSLKEIFSKTHPISFRPGFADKPRLVHTFAELAKSTKDDAYSREKAQAKLSDNSAALDKDFELSIITEHCNLESPAILEESLNDDTAAMMVQFCPRTLLRKTKPSTNFSGEIIFVADRSGSMKESSKMSDLRDALQVFLRSLPESCSFNIVSFGNNAYGLWEQSQAYNGTQLAEATNHVRSFKANLGGTNIREALGLAVDQRSHSSTQVILLTDGESWNSQDIIHFVEETSRDAEGNLRFFALGIGNNVSHELIEGIGRYGGGYSQVVPLESKRHWKVNVIQLLKGALAPEGFECSATLIREDGSAIVETMNTQSNSLVRAPYTIPRLHTFGSASIFYLLDRKMAEDVQHVVLRLRNRPDPEIVVMIPIVKRENSFALIHHLAAKSVISDIISGRSLLFADEMSGKSRESNRGAKDYVEELGTKYQVTSKWTSFIAFKNSSETDIAVRVYKAQMLDTSLLRRESDINSLRPGLPLNLPAPVRRQSCEPTNQIDLSYLTPAKKPRLRAEKQRRRNIIDSQSSPSSPLESACGSSSQSRWAAQVPPPPPPPPPGPPPPTEALVSQHSSTHGHLPSQARAEVFTRSSTYTYPSADAPTELDQNQPLRVWQSSSQTSVDSGSSHYLESSQNLQNHTHSGLPTPYPQHSSYAQPRSSQIHLQYSTGYSTAHSLSNNTSHYDQGVQPQDPRYQTGQQSRSYWGHANYSSYATPGSSNLEPQSLTLSLLVSTQGYDGSFTFTPTVSSLVAGMIQFHRQPTISLDGPGVKYPQNFTDENRLRLENTLFAVLIMKWHFPVDRPIWELIVQKAERWIATLGINERGRKELEACIGPVLPLGTSPLLPNYMPRSPHDLIATGESGGYGDGVNYYNTVDEETSDDEGNKDESVSELFAKHMGLN